MPAPSNILSLPRRIAERSSELLWCRFVGSPYESQSFPAILDARISWPIDHPWKHAGKWVEPIRNALSTQAKIVDTHIAQQRKNCITAFLSFEGNDEQTPIYFDFADQPAVEEDLVAENTPYFKLQYSEHSRLSPNVFPGGYIPNDPMIYPLIGHLRGSRRANKFRRDVYGRFGKNFAFELRSKCLEILSAAGRPLQGGFELKRYSKFLGEAAAAKICIDLPGNGPLCFRLIDYLALGCFVISFPHEARLPKPLIDGEHIVYMKKDMSDLPELVEYYLQNGAERERIAANAAQYFDTVLSNAALGSYYLHTAYEWISSASAREQIFRKQAGSSRERSSLRP